MHNIINGPLANSKSYGKRRISNNPSPAPSQFIFSIDICFFKNHFIIIILPKRSLPRGLFLVGLLTNILKGVLPYVIPSVCPADLNHLELITLTILGERYKLRKLVFGKPSPLIKYSPQYPAFKYP